MEQSVNRKVLEMRLKFLSGPRRNVAKNNYTRELSRVKGPAKKKNRELRGDKTRKHSQSDVSADKLILVEYRSTKRSLGVRRGRDATKKDLVWRCRGNW